MDGNNLKYWNKLCVTDPDYVTYVNFGSFKYHSVDPIHRAKMMTEMFGPCGTGWGFDAKHSDIHLPNGSIVAVSDVTLWYMPDGGADRLDRVEFGPIRCTEQAIGENGKLDPDAWKKATTDAIGKAMSYIGMSADVYEGKFDDDRYVQAARDRAADDREDRALKMLHSKLMGEYGCASDQDVLSICSYLKEKPYSNVAQIGPDAMEIQARLKNLDKSGVDKSTLLKKAKEKPDG